MKYFSMFSGIGGFEKGIEDAGDKWQCIGYSEIDRYASAIFRYHYPNVTNYGDATKLVPEELPDFDCLIGGFPCQSFSIAGKRRGFQDTRGTLFFDICRVARVERPSFLFLENVKGLLSHDEGITFQTILESLDELGYDCQWQVLNSKFHGVPQNRERVFIIGHSRNISRPKVFPIGGGYEKNNELQAGLIIGAITARRCDAQDANYSKGQSAKGQCERTLIHTAYQGDLREYKEISPTISTPSGGGHLPYVASAVLTPNRIEKRQNGRRTKNPNEPMFTLTGQDIHGVEIANAVDADGYLRDGKRPRDENGKPQLLPIGYRRIRRLTPIECERLQGFPDSWSKYGLFEDGQVKEISDFQRYKCLGNAVTTNVIRDIVTKWQEADK